MTGRAYTVNEVEDLRAKVRNKILWGRYSGPTSEGSMSRSYREPEMSQQTEARIQTHMLAGHTAADLVASDSEPPENH